MMKKLLVVGASILQLPGIKRAKELGFFVATVDRDPNAIAIPFADAFYPISTIDKEGIYQVAKELKVDGIVTLATDMPMRAIANATTKLHLPGISEQSAIKATDKGKMISAFKEFGVESPEYVIVKGKTELTLLAENFHFPLIMKPVDNSGSRGVVLLQDKSQLESAYEYSHSQSRDGEVIVEEYLQGHEVSVEVFTFNNQTKVLAITDKLTTGVPHFVEMGHSQPSRLSEGDKQKISDLAIRAVKAIGINLGPAHVEIMVTSSGPKLIELGARLGGDCITSHLVPLSTGIDMVGATILCAAGEIPDLVPKFQKGSAIRYFDVPQGILTGLTGVENAQEIQGIKEIVFTKKIGDYVGEVTSSGERIGFVIAQSETAKDAIEACESAEKMVSISIN